MKLKILSDGGRNTRVIDEETGEPLDGVVSILWSIQPNEEAHCILEMEAVPVEIVGDRIKRYELDNLGGEEPRRAIDEITDEERERVRKHVPEMPTHRRET